MTLKDVIDAFKIGRKFTSKSSNQYFNLTLSKEEPRTLIAEGAHSDYVVDKIIGDQSTKTERVAFYCGTVTHPLTIGRFLFDYMKDKI
jgi:hypothetical protein